MADPTAVKFRDRFRLVASIERAEQRAASLELRWKQLNGIIAMAAALGLLPDEGDRDEETVRERWAKLRAET